MKQLCLVSLVYVLLLSCSAGKDPRREQARQLQRGVLTEDTSWVYRLPYAEGSSHLVLQGYFSRFSHRNRAALDFKMKRGTPVLAARGGVVIRLQEQNDKGGWNRKFRQFANYIVIAHSDSTNAGYWHLRKNGAVVNLGDTVKAGQLIGYSGNTGYTTTPHLHFMVWKRRGNNWTQVPTRFMTNKGAAYLRPLRWYRNGKKPG
ncbi:MAG TPA: M23 family metallopeptidase [Chitinophagaceae bacterium]